MTKFQNGNIRAGKLSLTDVLRIRELYHMQGFTQRKLGDMYHVTTETIGRIVRNDTWKDYGGPGAARGEMSVAEAQRDEAMQLAAERYSPPVEPIEIQASLARLAKLMEDDQHADTVKTDSRSDCDSSGSGTNHPEGTGDKGSER